MTDYANRIASVEMQLKRGERGLAKQTSNLFRSRGEDAAGQLDVSALQHVLGVD